MIILYEEHEKEFKTLGIGILKDAISCEVTEELNGAFELELEYPINGLHYKDISNRKIIFAKPNKYDDYQAFRIYSISKPFDGKITVNAEHLSYDLSGYIINPFDEPATGIQDAFDKINSHILDEESDYSFSFETDIENTETKFNIQVPCSVRSILAGNEGSLLDLFRGEYKFDNFKIIFNKTRGEKRGFSIRYGKNMTDLKQEITSEKLYTDIYPYFYRITSETETSSNNTYQKAWVRTSQEGEEPIEPFSKDWLSLKENLEKFTPIVKNLPLQIQTEGEYKDKIYIWSDFTDPETGEIQTKYIEVSEEDYPPTIPSPIGSVVETTEMTILDEKTIPIEGREDIRPKRILSLDLTDKFNDKPTQEELREYATKYIEDNNIGELNEIIEASFIKIDDPSINECICLLGDTVNIYFNELGINSELRIISTKYNVLVDRYSEIGLGKKESNLTDNTLQIGDDISSLNNDSNYTDEIKVVDLIAKNITADYIQAQNVEFTEAQINILNSDSIFCGGIIQAAEGAIDTLIAELLVAEDAAIRNQLIVGEGLIVNGEINIKSGTISITNDGNIEYVEAYINPTIDENPSTKYNSQWLKTTFDGTQLITPQNGVIYKVFDKYNIWTQEYYEWDTSSSKYKQKYIYPETCFEVDSEGNVYANSVDLRGKITATSGEIGGCTIDEEGHLVVPSAYVEGTFSADQIIGGTISASEIYLKDDEKSTKLAVDSEGNLEANSIKLEGGTIENLNIVGRLYFGNIYEGAYERTDIQPWWRYTSKWLKKNYLDTTPLVPVQGTVYDVVLSNGTRQFYIFNTENEEYELYSDEVYYIDDNGIKLPGILSTVDSTHIAGFEVSDNTLISYNATKEVGLSSDIDEDFAIWAGKENNLGEHPFYVTHEGYLKSITGQIGNFNIQNSLTTNEDKSSVYDLEDGLYLNSDGIGYYDSNSDSRVAITSQYGIVTTNIQLDPFKRLDAHASSTNGTTPIMDFAIYTFDDSDTSSKNPILALGLLYEYNKYTFMVSYTDVLVASDTTREIRIVPAPIVPLDQDYIADVEILNVMATLTRTSSVTYEGEANFSVWWENNNTEYRGNTGHTIYVHNPTNRKIALNLLVIFKADR